jgi:ribosomal protein L37AE/L43A
MSATQKMSLFESFTGYRATQGTKQHKMQCPFCKKEDHFFYNDEALWDCKVCGKKGNAITFVRLIYDLCVNAPERLMEKKGLPRRSIEEYGIKINPLTDHYVFPTYNDGKLNNLYRWFESDNTIRCPIGMEHTLVCSKQDSDDWKDDVWLFEGHFDVVAGKAMVGSTRDITCLAVPGANVFKPTWLPKFEGKNLTLLFDNDNAGEEGTLNILKHIEASPKKPKSVRYILWEDQPGGYDIRDLYVEHGRKAFSMLPKFATSKVEAPKNKSIEPDLTYNCIEKVLEEYGMIYHITPDIQSLILVILASIYSVNLDGEQVWLKVIGPAGCGKTRVAKAVSASSHVVLRSTFTGLFSGWSDDNEDDPSMIPLIASKTLIVKDADALLRQGNIEKILSELRDFYDKDSSVQYRNRKHYNYQDVRSSIIICGTTALRMADNSFLGERFVDIELSFTEEEEEAMGLRALDHAISLATNKVIEPETKLKAAFAGFIDVLYTRRPHTDFETLPQEIKTEIWRCAWLSSRLRTDVPRNQKGDITMDPQPEVPTRLVGQFINLAISLCAVFNINIPDERVLNLVRKISIDIVGRTSVRYKICKYLSENENKTLNEIEEAANIPKTTAWRHMNDLEVLGFVRTGTYTITSGSIAGKRGFVFNLDAKIKDRFNA